MHLTNGALWFCVAVSIREMLGLEDAKVVEINADHYPKLEVSIRPPQCSKVWWWWR